MLTSTERLRALVRTELLDTPPEPRFDRITARALDVTGAAVSALSLVDGDRCFFKSMAGLPEGQVTRTAAVGDCLCAVVVDREDVLAVEDARTVPSLQDCGAVARLGTVAYLGVPVRDPNGHCVGSLCVAHPEKRQWTDAHIDAMRDLAALASAEVAFAVATVEARQASRRAHRLETVADRLSLAASVAEAAQIAVDALRSAVDATGGVLAVASDDGARLQVVAASGVDGSSALDAYRDIRSDAELPAAEAFRLGGPVIVGSHEELADRYPALRDVVDRRFQAWICVPLMVESRAVGVAWFLFTRPRTFLTDDETLLMAIGRQAGQAIARSRLFDSERRAREKAEALVARMRTLETVTRALSGAVDVERISRDVVERGAAALAADTAGLWIPAESGSELVLLQQVGFEADLAATSARLAIDGRAPVAAAFRESQPIWLGSAAEYGARFPSSLSFVRSRRPELIDIAAACLPLAVDGRRLGVLFFGFESLRQFDDDERTFITVLAQHCAQALDRVRLFEELRSLATERATLLDSERAARQTAEDALERAHLADRRKDEVLAILSHELRNPLAPITTALELLAARTPSTGRELEVIGRQVQHLTRLVDDLLDVSRIVGGKVELRRTVTELSALVANAIEQTSPLFEQKALALNVEVPSAGLPVDVDPSRLAQVIANLLTNAAKHTGRGGCIAVCAEAAAGDVVLRVRDTGAGIPPALLPHVFDLFVQAPQSLDRSRGGLGLGLTIVKRIVEMHGGNVAIASDGPGTGTEVTVRLPRSSALANSSPGRVALSPDRSQGTLQRRVMVVDDNEDAAELLAEGLRHVGCTVALAYDGPSAVALAAQFCPEVVLLDIGLPVMDGYEVARQLKHGGPGGPRLIALTGYGQREDRDRATRAGFDAHLVKPVGLCVIIATVSGVADPP